MILITNCSPAPKYHSRRRPAGDPKTETRKAPRRSPTAPFEFLPPLRRYGVEKVTSRFGRRRNPEYGISEIHRGIDIDAEDGEEVIASAAGTVGFAGRQGGFGNVVIMDHGHRFCTVYAHLSKMLVKEGDVIRAGDAIGRVGRSGNAAGTHLHFEIRKGGEAVDPLHYLQDTP